MKNEIAPEAFSEKYSLSELAVILSNNEGRKRAAIFDLDGTIHRGFLPKAFYEASNADLALYLLPEIIAHSPFKIIDYASAGISIVSKIISHSLKKSGAESDSEIEEIIIREFSEKILSGIKYEAVLHAAEKVPRHAYQYSFECIKKIGKNSGSSAIISKTFQPILDSYAREFMKYGLEMKTYGNRLLVSEGRITGIDNSQKILEPEDKARFCRKAISGLDSCVIFANSEEDIGMFEEGDALLGKYNCLKISMNASSRRVIEKSDVYFRGWKPIKNILQILYKKGAKTHYFS
jgi:phosphoserine phosphatase